MGKKILQMENQTKRNISEVAPCGSISYAHSRLKTAGLLDEDKGNFMTNRASVKKKLRCSSKSYFTKVSLKNDSISIPIPLNIVSCFNRKEAIEILYESGKDK